MANKYTIKVPTNTVYTPNIYTVGSKESPEQLGRKWDADLLKESGVIKKANKNNTTFTGTKKSLGYYFGAYGNDLSQFKLTKVKQIKKVK